jgi:hypothetical protein
LLPTIAEVTATPCDGSVDGHSLLPVGDRERPRIFAEYGDPVTGMEALASYSETPLSAEVVQQFDHPLQCVRTPTEKYIRVVDGDDEFYEFDAGDRKRENLLAGVPDRRATERTAELRTALKETLEPLPSVGGRGDMDPKVRRNLTELGYL